MFYRCIRPLLFLLPPEAAHKFTLNLLKLGHAIGINKFFFRKPKPNPIKLWGLNFKNRIGIAAGLDKNGDYIDALASLGVSFIEVGGVTPIAQAGNPKPRIFRLTKEKALINFMGLNNNGVDYLVNNLKKRNTDCVIGVNISKNHHTSNDDAYQDYLICLEKVYTYADFVVINVSCPNSSAVDKLQQQDFLADLLDKIVTKRDQLQSEEQRRLPLVVKIAPDLNAEQLGYLIKTITVANIDGIIATNTSTQRYDLNNPLCEKKGGLSGAPLQKTSIDTLKMIKQLAPDLPVISVGGIMGAKDINQRLELGADLVEIYTGLIYQGLQLIQ